MRQEPFFRLRNLIGDRSKELVYDRGNQDANFLITKASDRNDKNAVFSLVGGMGKTTLYRNWRYSSKPTREISHFQLDGFYIFNSIDFTFSTRDISCFQLERFHVSNSRDFMFPTREISYFQFERFHIFNSRDFRFYAKFVPCYNKAVWLDQKNGHTNRSTKMKNTGGRFNVLYNDSCRKKSNL